MHITCGCMCISALSCTASGRVQRAPTHKCRNSNCARTQTHACVDVNMPSSLGTVHEDSCEPFSGIRLIYGSHGGPTSIQQMVQGCWSMVNARDSMTLPPPANTTHIQHGSTSQDNYLTIMTMFQICWNMQGHFGRVSSGSASFSCLRVELGVAVLRGARAQLLQEGHGFCWLCFSGSCRPLNWYLWWW